VGSTEHVFEEVIEVGDFGEAQRVCTFMKTDKDFQTKIKAIITKIKHSDCSDRYGFW